MNVPTLDEAGLKGFSYDSWFGIMATAGTPKAVIDKVNKDAVAVLQDKDLQERLAKQGGITIVTTTPAQFDTNTERYTRLFAAAGIGAK